MSDIKLFRLEAGKATELAGDASDLEKPLQTLIEANLDTLLGIRFLASEYSTGKTHGGRIDSLGLDSPSTWGLARCCWAPTVSARATCSTPSRWPRR